MLKNGDKLLKLKDIKRTKTIVHRKSHSRKQKHLNYHQKLEDIHSKRTLSLLFKALKNVEEVQGNISGI